MGEVKRTDSGWTLHPTLTKAAPSQPGGGSLLPRGRIVRVTFDMIVPNAATRDDIEEWVRYETGGGSISLDNPLSDHNLEPHGFPVLQDLGVNTDILDLRDQVVWRPA